MATIATIDGIPVYNAIIGDDSQGMQKISLVDLPAVLTDFVKLRKEDRKEQTLFAIQNEEKRLVYGVIMRADFPIYRYSEKEGEYYIIYKADTIRQMAEKYLADGNCNNVNLMHEEGTDVEGVQMVQYFIKDTERGISPTGFESIADGSLFGEFHCTNDEVWEEIKAGTYRGFSLEGYFDLVPNEDVEGVSDIVDRLAGAFSALFSKTKSKNNMTRLERIKAAIAKALVAFSNCTTDKGILYWDGEEEIAVDDFVFTDEGKNTPAEDGEYTREDGTTIVVVGGKVTEIKPKEEEPAPAEMSKVTTDGGDLVYAEEGDLVAGTAVFTDETMTTPAPDGEYKTEDKIIVVADGVVAEIKEIEEVEPTTGETALSRRIKQIVAEMSASFTEKEEAIVRALKAVGLIDFWLTDAGDDFAVVEVWDGSEYKLFRYPITFAEDGSVTVTGEGEESKWAVVPIDFDPATTSSPATTETGEEVEQLRAQVAELEAKLSKKPAAPSAHTAFGALNSSVKASNEEETSDRRCVRRKTL